MVRRSVAEGGASLDIGVFAPLEHVQLTGCQLVGWHWECRKGDVDAPVDKCAAGWARGELEGDAIVKLMWRADHERKAVEIGFEALFVRLAAAAGQRDRASVVHCLLVGVGDVFVGVGKRVDADDAVVVEGRVVREVERESGDVLLSSGVSLTGASHPQRKQNGSPAPIRSKSVCW